MCKLSFLYYFFLYRKGGSSRAKKEEEKEKEGVGERSVNYNKSFMEWSEQASEHILVLQKLQK